MYPLKNFHSLEIIIFWRMNCKFKSITNKYIILCIHTGLLLVHLNGFEVYEIEFDAT
jgi:hypothetical protein